MPASYRRSVQCENYRDRVFFAHKTWGKITRLYVILNHGHGVRFSRIQRRCALLPRTRIVNAVRVDINVWLQRQSPDLLHTTNRYMARWPLRHAVLPGFSHAIPHYFIMRRPHWFRSNGASWSSAFLWSAEYLNAPCFSAQFCSPCIRRRPGCINWRARSVSTSIRWRYPDLLFLFTVTRRWVIIDSMWTTGTAVMAQVYLCFVCVIKKTTMSMYRLC